MTHAAFGLTVHAEAEVRRADGSLRHSTPASSETVRVTIEELRAAVARNGTTDDRLRELGFTDETIRQIRSTP